MRTSGAMLKGVGEGDGLVQWQQRDQKTSLRALEMAMAWLSPQELAHLAGTCHAMATAVRTLTHSRTADAAQGLERWPVPVVNRLDSCRYPWFRYTPFCCRSFSSAHTWGGEGEPSRKDFDAVKLECQEDLGIFPRSGILGNAVGCRCADNCHLAQQNQCEFENKGSWNSGCTCGRINDGARAYTRESKLKLMEHSRIPDAVDENQTCRTVNHSKCSLNSPSKYNKINGVAAEALDSGLVEFLEEGGDLEEGPPLVLECGGACLCSVNCGFRITQQGLSVRVTVLRQPQTGWGLHAAQNICKGSFVCEYAGELLTTAKSRERQKSYDTESGRRRCGSALLVIREYLPSGDNCVRTNIDATRVGNVARFINHACDGGNLLPCLVRSAGSVIPRLVLFSRRHINEGEELTYSYGSCGSLAGEMQPCYCGTDGCYGTLPSEST